MKQTHFVRVVQNQFVTPSGDIWRLLIEFAQKYVRLSIESPGEPPTLGPTFHISTEILRQQLVVKLSVAVPGFLGIGSAKFGVGFTLTPVVDSLMATKRDCAVADVVPDDEVSS